MDIFTFIQKILIDERIAYSISKKNKIIKLNTPVKEIIFCNIVQKFTDVFGNPKFVDSYYGYIWHTNEQFISFNIIETGYNIENMYIYVFKKLPFSKRIDYMDYVKLDTMIADTLNKYNFFCDNLIHYRFTGKEYLYFGHGIKHECIIILKKNYLKISLSEKQHSKTGYRLIPVFNKNFKISKNDPDAIPKILSMCFCSLENNET